MGNQIEGPQASEGVSPDDHQVAFCEPETLRFDVIQWGHCSKVACHPGVSRSLFLTKQRFWWPSMARNVQCFVLACSVCAVSKTSNRHPAGLLQLLPFPSRPWSHILLLVLTVVDRFSKATHFIALSKLPSARETAVAVIDHFFSYSWPP